MSAKWRPFVPGKDELYQNGIIGWLAGEIHYLTSELMWPGVKRRKDNVCLFVYVRMERCFLKGIWADPVIYIYIYIYIYRERGGESEIVYLIDIHIFVVKLTTKILTMRGQQHSFSTHERKFLWKCRSFRDRLCIDPRGTRTPNLRIHAEYSDYLSYQGQAFAVPCFCEARRASHCHSPQTTYSSKSTCCAIYAQNLAMHVVVYAGRLTSQRSIVEIINW